MSFAAAEARINAAVVQHLANAVVDFGGGVTVAGIFGNDYAGQFGIDGTVPVFQCKTADVSAVVRGTAIVINAVNYKAVRKESDGTGWTTVILELAA